MHIQYLYQTKINCIYQPNFTCLNYNSIYSYYFYSGKFKKCKAENSWVASHNL